jgi:hypothetical protein
VHFIPMRLREQVTSTLNLFGTAPDGLGPGSRTERPARWSMWVTIGILQGRPTRQEELMAGQLQVVALDGRVIIEQAEGVLAERIRVTHC